MITGVCEAILISVWCAFFSLGIFATRRRAAAAAAAKAEEEAGDLRIK
jgi:hypothetical protein